MANIYNDGNIAEVGDIILCCNNKRMNSDKKLPIPFGLEFKVDRLGPSQKSVIINYNGHDYLSQRFNLVRREAKKNQYYRVIK